MADGAQTKGVAFLGVKGYVLATFGEAGWQRVLDALDPADAETVRGALAVGWYDLHLYARFIRAIDAALGKGDLSQIRPMARFAAENDLKIYHRLFFRLLNPAAAVEKSGEYWRRYHDTGSWEMQRVSPTEAVGTLSGWGIADDAMCLELCAFMARLLELVGARNVKLDHPRCRARGADACFFRCRWD